MCLLTACPPTSGDGVHLATVAAPRQQFSSRNTSSRCRKAKGEREVVSRESVTGSVPYAMAGPTNSSMPSTISWNFVHGTSINWPRCSTPKSSSPPPPS